MNLIQVCRQPRIFVADEFLGEAEIAALLELTGREARGAKESETGLSFELPLEADAALGALAHRLEERVGIGNRAGTTFRFRRYAPGQYHPLHHDHYSIDGARLVATAMLCLTTPGAGGETAFPDAGIQVRPRAGRLLLWLNHRPDGAEDETARHWSRAVRAGLKTTLTWFIYADPAAAAVEIAAGEGAAEGVEPHRLETEPPPRALFCCVNDGVPVETTALLRAACRLRHVEYLEVQARSFDFAPERVLKPGDLLFRPAVSTAALRVEQFLYTPGVATFHDVSFECSFWPLVLARRGVPTPLTIPCNSAGRDILLRQVAWLGGFPVILKCLGGSGGVGVMRVDSSPALFSLVDHLLAQGHAPVLSQYLADAIHWRVVVVGERAVAAYRNLVDPDDFRTHAAADQRQYFQKVREPLADVAIRAAAALRVEHAGVDVLEDAGGAFHVLEANYPCYFPQAQLVAGIDVAGAMIEHLLAKSERLVPVRRPVSRRQALLQLGVSAAAFAGVLVGRPEKTRADESDSKEYSNKDFSREMSNKDYSREVSSKDSSREISSKDGSREINGKDNSRESNSKDNSCESSRKDNSRETNSKDNSRESSRKDNSREGSRKDDARDQQRHDDDRQRHDSQAREYRRKDNSREQNDKSGEQSSKEFSAKSFLQIAPAPRRKRHKKR